MKRESRRRPTVVASDWLQPRWGISWTAGVVVGTGRRAAYVRVEPGGEGSDGHGQVPPILAIEGPEGVGLPNGVVAPAAVVASIRVGDRVALHRHGWSVTGPSEPRVTGTIGRWHRSRPPLGPAPATLVRTRLRQVGPSALPDGGLPWPASWALPDDVLLEGVRDLLDVVDPRDPDPPAHHPVDPGPDLDAVLDRLVGWGPGSTPSGDDVLAGCVAVMRVAGASTCVTPGDLAERLGRRGHRTTPLSATLLSCALDGAMARPAARLVTALTAGGGPDPRGVERELARLDQVGHSSGRDLAVGILATVHRRTTPTTDRRGHPRPALVSEHETAPGQRPRSEDGPASGPGPAGPTLVETGWHDRDHARVRDATMPRRS